MREILFRGKQIDNGEWVEGYYIGEQKMVEKKAHWILDKNDIFGRFHYRSIDPNTLGQYTGLTDKNDKKIFEGDIVKVEKNDHDWHEHDPNSYSVFAVEFDEGGYTAGDYFLQNWLWFDEFHGEVIGNIHDNPELLEEQT